MKVIDDLLEDLYIDSLDYKKAGLIIGDIIPEGIKQLKLLSTEDKNSKREENKTEVNKLYDFINQKHGLGTLYYASQGNKFHKRAWQAKQSFRSPCFTTRWEDLYNIY